MCGTFNYKFSYFSGFMKLCCMMGRKQIVYELYYLIEQFIQTVIKASYQLRTKNWKCAEIGQSIHDASIYRQSSTLHSDVISVVD